MKSAKCQLQHRLVALGCPSVALVAPYCGASKPSFPGEPTCGRVPLIR